MAPRLRRQRPGATRPIFRNCTNRRGSGVAQALLPFGAWERVSVTRKPVVLVTGAGGEVGHGLIHHLAELGVYDVLALDVRAMDDEVARRCAATRIGDILDRHLLDRLRSEFEISVVFHLAALLSTRAEFVPETAHEVNVEGTLNLLRLAVDEARSHGHPVKFLFPSSIAVYGLPDLDTKRAAGQGGRGRVAHAHHDVRLQQALLRAPRPLLRASLPPARGRASRAASTSARSASPG